MGAARAVIGFAVALAVSSCATRTLPPLGEAVVVVDTDLPVPLVASALRVDTYDAGGVWLDSRDIVLRDPRDWPASFSVQASDDHAEHDVVVRIRVHGERMRDVVGGPRLVVDGVDRTPASEPTAALTVDRLLLVRLRPGERGRAVVVARASCAGAVPSLDPKALASCTEGEGTLDPVAITPLDPDLSLPTRSVAGTAASSACRSRAAGDSPCIDGGAFVLGADDVQVVPDPTVPLSPERIARVRSFAIDRDEVTVGAVRAAIAHGLVVPDPIGATEGELGTTADTTCSFSAAPRGREQFAITCITWRTARAYCMFSGGGDLPTEAQWEYVATSAARTGKSMFPWGDDPPDCARAVYGRLALAGLPGSCEAEGTGPLPVASGLGALGTGDLSATQIRGLGGGVAEWTRDTPAPYDAPCWSGIDASCSDPATDAHVVRGGAWASTAINVRSTARLASRKSTSFIGFRCVYPG